MAVTNGSYDEFLNALRAQAPQPQTPTGGAIDLRNRLFNPTPTPAPPPVTPPKPRADMGIDYTPTGTVAAPAPTDGLPVMQQIGLGVRSFMSNMGQAQIAADQPEINAGRAIGGAVGGGLSNLAAGLGGQATPVVAVTPAQAAVDTPNTTPLADRAGPIGAVQGPALAASAKSYMTPKGAMSPDTHSLEDFMEAHQGMKLGQELMILRAMQGDTPQARAQNTLRNLADVRHLQALAAAKTPEDVAAAHKAYRQELTGVYNPQASMYVGVGQN